MTLRKWLTFVEIDLPVCALSYGVAPCMAALGVTGEARCFNSVGTCQDRENYAETSIPLRFVQDTGYQAESGIEATASLVDVDLTPGRISLGETLGQRPSVSCVFRDHPHPDTGPGGDPYRATRGYDAYRLGTFWARFAARFPNLRGKRLRVIQGYVGQSLGEMETRHYIIDSVDGPGLDGRFTITAKDPLKALDGERAQAPKISTGFLSADIADSAGSATLAPSGVGATYPETGWVSSRGEVMAFTRAGDVLTLTRGQKGTTAEAHKAGDRVQLCLAYTAEDPAEIIRDLLVSYGSVPAGYVPLDDWLAETATYNGQVYTALIPEPTPVKTLVAELIEQAGLAVWWDEIGEQVRLQVLRQIATDAQLYDETMIRKDSLKLSAQPDKRLSQVWVYFAQRDPTEGDDLKNFPGVSVLADADAEADYGSPAVKTIVSRWIPAGGRLIAERLCEIQLGRYLSPPRQVSFELIEGEGAVLPVLGDGFRLSLPSLQDASGARRSVPFQVTRIRRAGGVCAVTAEEAAFVEIRASDPLNRIISIDYASYRMTWRTLHDNLFGAPVAGGTVTLQVSSAARIGSTSNDTFALRTGDWPSETFTATRSSGSATLTGIADTSSFVAGQAVTGAGIPRGSRVVSTTADTVTLDKTATATGSATLTLWLVILKLDIRGRIAGKGGNGGAGKGGDNNRGGSGQDGGTGLGVTAPIEVIGDGKIDGGGGGGGGGGGDFYGIFGPQRNGGGGGGGAGDVPGTGGVRGGSGAVIGQPGTLDAGGVGGKSNEPGWRGGNGGGPGEAGEDARGEWWGRGGDAGAAVDGYALVRDDSFTGAWRGAKID